MTNNHNRTQNPCTHMTIGALPFCASLTWKKVNISTLIRLLSLSVYILNKTGTAVNKVKSLLKSWQAFAGFHAEAASWGHLEPALANPKDKDPKANQTGVIYQYQCPYINCSSSYIGESGRSLGERVKEHLKAPSPIHLHSATSGHPLEPNQFNIVHKEVNSQSRTIKEAMFICIQDPPQQKLGQVPTATYMGPALTCITNVPVQANTAANNHINPITPYW